MIDLLLIFPQSEIGSKVSETYYAFGQPMGIFSMGSYVAERRYNVKLLDMRMFNNLTEEALKWAKDAKLIGLSVMTSQIEHALIISKAIKEEYPEKKIIWGGVHPSLFPEQALANPLIDYVVVGEGEKAIIQLLENPEQRERVLRPPMLASEELPKFNYDLVPVERYIPSKVDKTILRKLDYATSRGCLFRCKFCINVVLWKRNYRMLPPERVLDELEEILKKYKLDAIWFLDEEMLGNKPRFKKIVQGIIDRKIKFIWKAHFRVNYFREDYINEEFLGQMHKAGLREVGHGIESGSKRVRDFIQKDITEEQVLRSAELYNKLKIRPEYSFMCAIPTETKKEFFETLELIDKIKERCPEAVILGPQPYRPYPGGELYDLAVKLGFKPPTSLEDWVKEMDLFTSSVKPERFPWVDKNMISLYENVGKYVTIGTRKFSQVWDLSKMM